METKRSQATTLAKTMMARMARTFQLCLMLGLLLLIIPNVTSNSRPINRNCCRVKDCRSRGQTCVRFGETNCRCRGNIVVGMQQPRISSGRNTG
ncbi:hypothetical protein DPMN_146962 [Dreissena polymorpha]|uniref:Uncharacterized protein n=1 Tax=Dreissena polymorpha TaxID=45954 RepID=A0A9D4F833_DREPO|nr:hypothetical protein DPMN_146962 [Dreissena polymorpha]